MTATKKLNDYKFEQAVESAINNAGAADLVSVKANIDMSKVSQTEDGSITGLDEQLAELKQSKPFSLSQRKNPKRNLTSADPQAEQKQSPVQTSSLPLKTITRNKEDTKCLLH